MASLPLRVGGEIVGTFNLYAGERGFFDEQEMRLLDELGSDIGFAVYVAQREAERRQSCHGGSLAPADDGDGKDDIVAATRDAASFSSAQERGGVVSLEGPVAPIEGQEMAGNMMLFMDPPAHTRYRKLVNRGFTPRMIAALEPHVRELTVRIVEDAIATGDCDFVVDAAAELPLAVIAALVAFFMTINSAEQTMVPNLKGKELANALIELQDRGLYPRVQLRYSSNPADKGTILGQEPSPGTMMKSGREVTLQVSRGAVIDRVENYIGWKLTDLELHLQTLSTTYGPLLKLQTPVTSVFDNSPAGTIIQQSPAPGTPSAPAP